MNRRTFVKTLFASVALAYCPRALREVEPERAPLESWTETVVVPPVEYEFGGFAFGANRYEVHEWAASLEDRKKSEKRGDKG